MPLRFAFNYRPEEEEKEEEERDQSWLEAPEQKAHSLQTGVWLPNDINSRKLFPNDKLKII